MNKRVTVDYLAGGALEVRHVYEGRVVEEDDVKIVLKSGRYHWTFFKSAPYLTVEDAPQYQYGLYNNRVGRVQNTGPSKERFEKVIADLVAAGVDKDFYKIVRRPLGEWEDA